MSRIERKAFELARARFKRILREKKRFEQQISAPDRFGTLMSRKETKTFDSIARRLFKVHTIDSFKFMFKDGKTRKARYG